MTVFKMHPSYDVFGCIRPIGFTNGDGKLVHLYGKRSRLDNWQSLTGMRNWPKITRDLLAIKYGWDDETKPKQLHLIIPETTPMECAAGYASVIKRKPVQSVKPSRQKDLFQWRQLKSK